MSVKTMNASDLATLLCQVPQGPREELLKEFLSAHADRAAGLATELLVRLGRAEEALRQAERATGELKKMVDQVLSPPLLVAGVTAVLDGRCVVAIGNNRHEVAVHPKLNGQRFEVGDVVALTQEGNLIVDKLTDYRPPGRVAPVQGWHQGKLLIEHLPDQPLVVDPAPSLLAANVREGDRVLYQDEWKVALEVVERSQPPCLDDFVPVHPDQIGGLDEQMDELLLAVESKLLFPERTAELLLDILRGALLEGPPGTGKTLLVRALVTYLRTVHGKKVVFRNVPPGSWRDPYYGMSERRLVEPLKEAGRLLEEGAAELVIILYDELDTLGTRSAEVTSRIDSRVLNAFLHELDGLEQRPGLLVVGTTNRADLCDEALLRRFGGLVITVGRPDREAARAIFRCHLRPEVRFWTDGQAVPPEEMVERSIEMAVARLYLDTDPRDALAEIILAGGQRQLLWPRQVVSGAVIKNIVDRAKRAALRRSFVGPSGLVPEDLARAADEELASVACRIADPSKVREILGDFTLPIARVQPLRGGPRFRQPVSA